MEKYELLKFVDNDFELDVAVSPQDELYGYVLIKLVNCSIEIDP